MAVRTIGTGGDYTTIAAWEAALPAVLAEDEIGEVLAEDFREGRITISGVTTAADKRVILRAADGARHNGTAGSGARIYDAFGGTWGVLNIYVGHFRVEGVELYSDGVAQSYAVYAPSSAVQAIEVEGCLLHDIYSLLNGAPNIQESALFRNCGGWNFSSNGLIGHASALDKIALENCTLIKSAVYVANATAGLRYVRANNCYVGNFGGLSGYANFLQLDAASSHNGASDGSGSSAALRGLAPADQCQSVGGTWNLKLLATSALIGAGTPIPGLTADFEGDARDATAPDIGFDEYTAGGGVDPSPGTHEVAAADCAMMAIVAAPDVTQAHAVTAADAATVLAVEALGAAQAHVVPAGSLVAGVAVAGAGVAQAHRVAAQGIALTVEIAPPVVSDGPDVTVADVVLLAAVEPPSVSQVRAVAVAAVALWPVLGPAEVGQAHAVAADSVTLGLSIDRVVPYVPASSRAAMAPAPRAARAAADRFARAM